MFRLPRLIPLTVLVIALAGCTPPVDVSATASADARNALASETAAAAATADARNTATMDAGATSTQQVGATATSNAAATLTQEATNGQQTAAAISARKTEVIAGYATSTAQIEAITPLLQAALDDPAIENITVLTQALRDLNPYISEAEGSLEHNPNDEFIASSRVASDVTNFAMSIDIKTPYSTSKGTWDFGVLFRHTGANSQYRVGIASPGVWFLNEAQGSISQFITLNRGTVQISQDESIPIRLILVVVEGRGLLIMNGEYIGRLDTSRRIEDGDIYIATGMGRGNEQAGEEIEYSDLIIWKLPD